VHIGFAVWKDPTNPLEMMLFNAFVCGAVIAFATSDVVNVEPLRDPSQRGQLFQPWGLLRWWLSGLIYGFASVVVLLTVFPAEEGWSEAQTTAAFGTRLLCVLGGVITSKLYFTSNKVYKFREVVAPQNLRVSGGGTTRKALDGSPTQDYPVYWFFRALHSGLGYTLPFGLLVLILTQWRGLASLPMLLVAVTVSAATSLCDMALFPRRVGPW